MWINVRYMHRDIIEEFYTNRTTIGNVVIRIRALKVKYDEQLSTWGSNFALGVLRLQQIQIVLAV